MLYIGPHISISKGFLAAAKEAESIGANTFQYFSRNPRGGAVKAPDPEDYRAAEAFMREHDFGPILCHAPYTLNMASSTEKTREFAKIAFQEDLERLEMIPASLYNFHPGSHTKAGVAQGTAWITEILNDSLTDEMTTTVLLETMAGKGTEIGRSFEELKAIIDGTEKSEKLGVCLDTCHVFSAGYDIRDFPRVFDQFDRILGLDRLKAIHLNDSLTPFSANKDRHAALGEGEIGETFIRDFITSPWVENIPVITETPLDLEGHKREIQMLRRMRGETPLK